jgi:hypothetical protein
MTRLHEAARRALGSLNDLIANTTDPGVEALGARYELATALTAAPASVRDVLLRAIDFPYAQGLGYESPDALLDAYDAARAPSADQAAGPAALREAAAFYEGVLQQSLDPDSDPRYCTAVRDVVMGLRHRADAAQQPTSDRCPHGCNVSTCPCLACEADQPAAVSQPDKEEA